MPYRHCILVLLCINLFNLNTLVHAQQSETMTIFAASSLTDAFTELSAMFIEQHPEADISLNFAGSSTLAAQLDAGAPADVFASANPIQIQTLIDNDLIDAEQVSLFASNQLVVVMPADNPAQITSLEDLANEGILLVLAVPEVPIRIYTDALLETLNAQYGDDFAERVLNNLVSEEANVRQVVARIALGEADAGIVYRTDILGEVQDHVTSIPIEPSISPLAIYPIAPLADSPNQDLAQAFIDLVLSDEGQAILQTYGFCQPVIMDELQAEVTPEMTSEPRNETEDASAICE